MIDALLNAYRLPSPEIFVFITDDEKYDAYGDQTDDDESSRRNLNRHII